MGHSHFAFAMFICGGALSACIGSGDGGPGAERETTGNATTSAGTGPAPDATTPSSAQSPSDPAPSMPSSTFASPEGPGSNASSEAASPGAGGAVGMGTGPGGSSPEGATLSTSADTPSSSSPSASNLGAGGAADNPTSGAGGSGGADGAQSTAGMSGVPSGSSGGSSGVPCEVDHGSQVPSLAEYYADYFPIGVAIDNQYEQYSDTISKHFVSITAENEMKFEALQPQEGNFTFDTADRMVEFATERGMQVRGHALVWHNQTPSWVFAGSKEQVLERMRNHIQTVMQHFAGKVYAWDVVNEAILDDGRLRGEDGGSAWYEALGESYIAEAFRAAREADPNAKLYYNDYAHYSPARRQGIYDLLVRLLDDGVPIDGVGLQGHMHLQPGLNHDVIRHQTVQEEETAIELYAELGLDVQITEMDVSLYVLGEDYPASYTQETLTPELLDQQAARYREFLELFRKHKDVISSVVFWGIVDSNTWLSDLVQGQEDFPLLFDAAQEPKPAFWALVDFCP